MPTFVCASDMAECSTQLLEDTVEANEYVLTQAIAAAETAGVSYTALSSWGAIPHTILYTAKHADCDLIVVGSPTYSGWPRLQGGYIVKKIVAQAHQPVLLVGSAPSCLPGTAHWSRVLVVTDGVPNPVGSVEYTLTLAQIHALDPELLHFDTALRFPLITPASGLLTRVAAYATAAGLHDAIQREVVDTAHTIVETATQ